MKRSRKKFINSKKKFLIGGLAVVFAVGATLAVGFHQMNLANTVKTAAVQGEIQENFPKQEIVWDGETQKEVWFANTGSADAFLRVSYGDYWKYQDEETGNITLLPEKSGGTAVAKKNWEDCWKTDWTDGGDGWYYYKKVLEKGKPTAVVLRDVSFQSVSDERYEKAEYNLIFQMELVQASNDIEVSHDAVREVFDRDFANTDWGSGKLAETINWITGKSAE